MLSEEAIITLGECCEQVLAHPVFPQLWQVFEAKAALHMLSTKPEEAAERERVYAQLVGAREFKTFITELAQTKAELIDDNQPKDDIDDPSVHDIYKQD